MGQTETSATLTLTCADGYRSKETRSMIASGLITLLVVVWVLGVLFNAALSGAYASAPPTGPQAMGLVVPIFGIAIASVALILATWICVGRGGFDWVSGTPLVPTAVATVVMLGVCLAASGALGVWMEGEMTFGRAVVPIGVVCGVLVPLATVVLLLVCAWMDPSSPRGLALLRGLGGVLVVGALAGYALGSLGLCTALVQRARNREATRVSDQAFDEKWRKIREAPIAERIVSDVAEAGAETPLWVFAARLPEAPDDATSALLITRALKVPGFSADLERTITSEQPLYRFGCAKLIARATPAQRHAAWAGPLARSIRVTIAEMDADPKWLLHHAQLNPDPHSHVEALLQASDALGNPPETAAAVRDLKAAIRRLERGLPRDFTLQLFAKRGN
jgi:hypothetical protein